MIRLYIIQIGAFLAVWLSSYFNGLDIILALLFLVIIFKEAQACNYDHKFKNILIAVIWQMPGIVLSIAVVTGLWNYFNLGPYFIFLLEFWYTPLLPLITILAQPFLPQPGYYVMLLGTPLFLTFFYLGAAYLKKN